MEKPWLNSYPEGVPEAISTPDYLSITQMIDACLIKYADRKAYSNMGSSITFKELDKPFYAIRMLPTKNFRANKRGTGSGHVAKYYSIPRSNVWNF